MAIAGDVILKVTPSDLLAKASLTKANIAKLKVEFDNCKDIMNRTASYWIGEAGNLHRKLYHQDKDDIDKMLARLSEHPTDLELIAKTYMDVEDAVEQMANELPGDIIT